MKNDTVIYLLKTLADADACAYALTCMRPPYTIDARLEASQAYAAAFTKKEYHPGTAPDWMQLERGHPSVFVVVASR